MAWISRGRAIWPWLAGLFQGNLGISTTYGKPVLEVIIARFPMTIELALLSMVIALAVGIPAGVFAATHNNRPSDLVVRLFAMLGQSTPSFVFGLVLIYLLSVNFHIIACHVARSRRYLSIHWAICADDPASITLGFAFAAAVTRISGRQCWTC